MPANYFYGPQAEQFAFYRIPQSSFLLILLIAVFPPTPKFCMACYWTG